MEWEAHGDLGKPGGAERACRGKEQGEQGSQCGYFVFTFIYFVYMLGGMSHRVHVGVSLQEFFLSTTCVPVIELNITNNFTCSAILLAPLCLF